MLVAYDAREMALWCLVLVRARAMYFPSPVPLATEHCAGLEDFVRVSLVLPFVFSHFGGRESND